MAQIIAGGNEPSNGGNTEILQRIQTANWNDLKGKPFITVSSKGIANGLSSIPNDGADFGPDTPGTETSGIQEAWNYAVSNPIGIYGYKKWIPEIKLVGGVYIVETPIDVSSHGQMNLHISGSNNMTPYVYAKFNSGYVFNLGSGYNDVDVLFENMQAAVVGGYSPDGFIYWNSTETSANLQGTFHGKYLNNSAGGWSKYFIYINNVQLIDMEMLEGYGGVDLYGNASRIISIRGFFSGTRDYLHLSAPSITIANSYFGGIEINWTGDTTTGIYKVVDTTLLGCDFNQILFNSYKYGANMGGSYTIIGGRAGNGVLNTFLFQNIGNGGSSIDQARIIGTQINGALSGNLGYTNGLRTIGCSHHHHLHHQV